MVRRMKPDYDSFWAHWTCYNSIAEHRGSGKLEDMCLDRSSWILSLHEPSFVTDLTIYFNTKWLQVLAFKQWRKITQLLNSIATSTAFQQDHNGYTLHQDHVSWPTLAENSRTASNFAVQIPIAVLALFIWSSSQGRRCDQLDRLNTHVPYLPSVLKQQQISGTWRIQWWSITNYSRWRTRSYKPEAAGTEPNWSSATTPQGQKPPCHFCKIRCSMLSLPLKMVSPHSDARGLSYKEFSGQSLHKSINQSFSCLLVMKAWRFSTCHKS